MMHPDDPADIGKLIRRRGLPEAPASVEQVSEVRSDCFVGMMKVPEAHATFTLKPIIIQWRFKLSFTQSAALHKFLVDNEPFIAESCTKVMNGVHYRGTYMGMSAHRAAYTTLWGYDRWEDQGEWQKVLADKTSRFYQAVRELRGYWTSDPDSVQEHFGVAAGIDLENEGFLGLTVDAERNMMK